MIVHFIKTEIFDFIDDVKRGSISAILTLLFFGGAVGFGVFKVKQYYVERSEKAAQTVFSEAFDEYTKVTNEYFSGKQVESAINQQWEDVKVSLAYIDKKHGNTVYAAAAYALQAQVLMQQKQYEQALEAMQKALSLVSRLSPLFYLYSMELALMRIDAGNKEDGLRDLKELANDPKNQFSDNARFYVGYYYWSLQDIENAKKEWASFVRDSKTEEDSEAEKYSSPWALFVRSKLAQCA